MSIVSSLCEAADSVAGSPPLRFQKIFVTGGHGFIGSVVVQHLRSAGHEVRCLVRPSSNTQRIDHLSIDRIVGDVRDPASLRKGLQGQDAIIHLAGLSSWDLIDSPDMRETIEQGTANVLKAARDVGGVRVVFVSSVLAIGSTDKPQPFDETHPYRLYAEKQLAHSHFKRRAEELCQAAVSEGLDAVIVNPTEVYGPNDVGLITASNLVDFAKSNPVLVCNGGTSIVHTEDVAQGIIAALERGPAGERYILGGENITHRQLAELFLEFSGQNKRIVVVPNTVLRSVTLIAQALRVPLPYNPRVVPYATRYFWVDSSKATRDLGITFRSARETLALQ